MIHRQEILLRGGEKMGIMASSKKLLGGGAKYDSFSEGSPRTRTRGFLVYSNVLAEGEKIDI